MGKSVEVVLGCRASAIIYRKTQVYGDYQWIIAINASTRPLTLQPNATPIDHPLNLRAYRFNIQMIEFKQYFGGEGQRWKRGRKTSRIELIPDHPFHCLPWRFKSRGRHFNSWKRPDKYLTIRVSPFTLILYFSRAKYSLASKNICLLRNGWQDYLLINVCTLLNMLNRRHGKGLVVY